MPDPDRFARRGPVRVSAADRTHLAHADGTPFFFLADTAWNGALLSTESDWATYLDDRAAKDFTAIQFITHAPWTAALTNREGRTAFTGDPRRPLDEDFFARIDRRVQMINARGLLAVPVLAWAANFGASARLNVGHHASAAQLVPLLRAQVDRLARHHVLWLLAGDGVYGGFWRARKWKRVGRAVFGGDRPDRAPVALHPAGLTWPYAAFAGEPWLDLYGYQSSHSEHPRTLRWLQSGPPAQLWKTRPRPTINLEPVYEDIAPVPGRPPFDRAAVRRAAYWSLLNAPTAGVAYGAHGLWGWHDRPTEAMNHAGMGVGQPWHVAMTLPGSDDMKRLADCFTSLRWWTLRPDPDLIESQPVPGDPARFVAASRSDAGDLAVAYLPAGGTITLRPDHLAHDLGAAWFNPRTGDRVAASPKGSQFTAPDADDWLLVLSRT